ncbi:MAG TPA: 2-oxoacid:acceptor oxidoreductase family protein [Dehalococcoidia bacterium]|jgi:2-oxoglutarate ferredoxin oxidoreductase subunit gamma|nr:2-oxoacid:acceptor oxidoreductase family protein [Dehalococcoidia bacterium]
MVGTNEDQVVLLAGIGGQGIQVAGKTLANAAVYERKRALYYSLFDGGQRGGVSDCIVALSETEITTPPLIKQPCASLFAMDPNGLTRYEGMVRSGGLVVYNRSVREVQRFRYEADGATTTGETRVAREDLDVIELSATELSAEHFGNPLMAAMILLGALIERTGIVSQESAKLALHDAIRPGRHRFIPVNEQALELGAELAPELLGIPLA